MYSVNRSNISYDSNFYSLELKGQKLSFSHRLTNDKVEEIGIKGIKGWILSKISPNWSKYTISEITSNGDQTTKKVQTIYVKSTDLADRIAHFKQINKGLESGEKLSLLTNLNTEKNSSKSPDLEDINEDLKKEILEENEEKKPRIKINEFSEFKIGGIINGVPIQVKTHETDRLATKEGEVKQSKQSYYPRGENEHVIRDIMKEKGFKPATIDKKGVKVKNFDMNVSLSELKNETKVSVDAFEVALYSHLLQVKGAEKIIFNKKSSELVDLKQQLVDLKKSPEASKEDKRELRKEISKLTDEISSMTLVNDKNLKRIVKELRATLSPLYELPDIDQFKESYLNNLNREVYPKEKYTKEEFVEFLDDKLMDLELQEHSNYSELKTASKDGTWLKTETREGLPKISQELDKLIQMASDLFDNPDFISTLKALKL